VNTLVEIESETSDVPPIEIEVHGESFHQDSLEAISGPKDEQGKSFQVGVVLRCEPTNPHDSNAIRVEAFGQLLGHVGRQQASELSPVLRERAGGVTEGIGVIVGGWRNPVSEGHYGIRVWVPGADARRLGLESLPSLQAEEHSFPDLPAAGPSEVRISPGRGEDVPYSTVTVTCEEHFQDVINRSMPSGWSGEHWPVLVTLDLADNNPHSSKPGKRVAVQFGSDVVGYLTEKMSVRYSGVVGAARWEGKWPTAIGLVRDGTKGGQAIRRVTFVVRS